MPTTRRRRLARALVAVAVVLVTAPVAKPAAAATEPAPGLVMSVPESCGWLLAGETTPLRVVVRNDTGALLPDIALVPRLPEGFTAKVTREPSPLLAGRSASFHVSVTTPADAVAGQPATLAFDAVGGTERATVVLTQHVVAPPVAPANVVATAGDALATVTWQPGPARSAYPDAAGRAPRRMYVVTASPDGARTTVFDATTATVAGLTNGTTYTFTVAEWNQFGETASAPSAPVVPRGVPRAPTFLDADGEGSTRVVYWTVPADNGSPITGYTVTTYPGGGTVSAPAGATSAEVTGLADGTAYTFGVRATNALGTGPESNRWDGPPVVDPSEVRLGTDAETFQVELATADPSLDGWLVTVRPGGTERYVAAPPPTATDPMRYAWPRFPDVVPDTTVAVTVRGVNDAGAGPPVTATEHVVRDPEPVVVTGAVGRPGLVDFCFLGAWQRGSDVTEYAFAADARVTHLVAADRRIAAVGLAYDWVQNVEVAPVNEAQGRYWPATPAAFAVLAQNPDSSLGYAYALRDQRSARVEWAGMADWAGPTVDVEVVASPGGKTTYGPAGDGWLVVPDLAPGTSYTFTVRRLDPYGYGPAVVTEAVVPYDVPAKPTGITVVAATDEPGGAIVSWDPIVANGMELQPTRVLRDGDVATIVPGSVTSARVDVAPGTPHVFEVVPSNTRGTGPAGVSAPFTYPVDATPPAVVVTAPPAVTTSGRAAVSYAASDATSYDTRYRVARYDGDFGAYRYPAGWQAATATSAGVAARPGWTYCFGVRARDVWGNVSDWTADACTAAPIDDAALWATGAWTRGTSSRYYNGTYSSTPTAGAALTLSRVVATRRLALVATRCPTCGEVGVYVGGTLVKRVRLTATTRSYRQVVTVDLGAPRTARVTLKALSGRPYVDGLAALRTPPG